MNVNGNWYVLSVYQYVVIIMQRENGN